MTRAGAASQERGILLCEKSCRLRHSISLRIAYQRLIIFKVLSSLRTTQHRICSHAQLDKCMAVNR